MTDTAPNHGAPRATVRDVLTIHAPLPPPQDAHEAPIWARVLMAFASGDLLIYPAEFAARCKLDKATVYRACAELAQQAVLERSPITEDVAYRPGPLLAHICVGFLATRSYEGQRLAQELATATNFIGRVLKELSPARAPISPRLAGDKA